MGSGNPSGNFLVQKKTTGAITPTSLAEGDVNTATLQVSKKYQVQGAELKA